MKNYELNIFLGFVNPDAQEMTVHHFENSTKRDRASMVAWLKSVALKTAPFPRALDDLHTLVAEQALRLSPVQFLSFRGYKETCQYQCNRYEEPTPLNCIGRVRELAAAVRANLGPAVMSASYDCTDLELMSQACATLDAHFRISIFNALRYMEACNTMYPVWRKADGTTKILGAGICTLPKIRSPADLEREEASSLKKRSAPTSTSPSSLKKSRQ